MGRAKERAFKAEGRPWVRKTVDSLEADLRPMSSWRVESRGGGR